MSTENPDELSSRLNLLMVPGLGGQHDCYDELRAVWGDDAHALTIMALSNSKPMHRRADYLQLFAELAPDDRPYAIVANSFGCQRAYDFALTRPKNLRAVVFLSGFLGNPHRGLTAIGQTWLFQAWHRYPNNARIACDVHKWTGDYALEGMQRQINQSRRPEPPVMRARVKMMRRQATRLPALNIPSLILNARDDALLHPSAAHNLVKSLPRAWVRTLPGPHFLVQAKAATVAAEIDTFLAEVDFT